MPLLLGSKFLILVANQEATRHFTMSPGMNGNITTGNAAQSSVFVTIIKPATPNRYTTGIVITIERHA